MGMLDRYVIWQYVRTVLFGLIAFSVIFILVDMIENLDDFIDQNVEYQYIFLYYVYFLPKIFSLMVPVAMLLSALFVVGRMSSNNELTIIKCAGRGLYRFMLPLLVVGVVVSGMMLFFDGWLVPRINAERLDLEREHMKKHLGSGGRHNMFFQDSGNRIVSVEYYDEASAVARRVRVQTFDEADPTHLLQRLDAERMEWREAGHEWVAFIVIQRSFKSDTMIPIQQRETMQRMDSVSIGRLTLTPEVIVRMQQNPEEMELKQFHDYIERQRLAGSDIARLQVDFHGKIAFPFASLIVIFFGVPFAAVKRRGGLAVQFGTSIFMLFIYMVSQKLSQIFGYSGHVDPLLAAWLPNLLFLAAGLVIMVRVRK
jgi:lipopolysaccharide export system permease protein